MSTTTTTVGFAVIETTTTTDDAGNVVDSSSDFRAATQDEVRAILAGAQAGQPNVKQQADTPQ